MTISTTRSLPKYHSQKRVVGYLTAFLRKDAMSQGREEDGKATSNPPLYLSSLRLCVLASLRSHSGLPRILTVDNPYALAEIEKAAGVRGIPFEGETVVLKEQLATFFEVTLRTVENYLEQNAEELSQNGYEVISGNRLKELKLAIEGLDDPETDFGIIQKTALLGVLDFRAFLCPLWGHDTGVNGISHCPLG